MVRGGQFPDYRMGKVSAECRRDDPDSSRGRYGLGAGTAVVGACGDTNSYPGGGGPLSE